MNERYAKNGFTLIEILVSLAIMGMILTMVGMTLQSTLRAREQISKALQQSGDGQAILQRMTRDLSAAVSLYEQGGDRHFFYGENDGTGRFSTDSLDFVTTEDTWDPDRQAMSDVSECGYLLKPNPDKPSLYRLYRRSQAGISGSPIRGGTLVKLHDRVVALNFEYRKASNENQNNSSEAQSQGSGFTSRNDLWLDEWNDRNHERALPELIRITLILQVNEDDENRPTEKEFRILVSPK